MGNLIEKISVYQRTVQSVQDRHSEATNTAIGLASSPSVARQWSSGHGLAWWASDHLEEIRHYAGWTFVGIHAIAKQFSNSKITVSRIKKRVDQPITKSHVPDASADPKELLPHHPIVKLLQKPNRVDSWSSFSYRIACQMRLTGAFLIWEVKNQLGYPFELWCIPRGWATPVLPSPQFPEGAWRINPSSTSTGVLTAYLSQMGFVRDAREFIQGGYPHPMFPGEFMSPLSACAKQIDLAEQVDDSVWSVFNNMTLPGMLLSVDPEVSLDATQMEQLEAKINAYKAGTSNRGKAMVLQGVKRESLDNPLTGLDHIDGRDQNRDHVLSIQHVPPIAIGADSDGSYAGAAAKMKQFTELSVQPDLNIVAQAFQARWSSVYGDDIEIALDARGYDDPQLNISKASTVLQAKSGGVRFSDNEIRSLLGFSNIPGGDVYEEAQQPGPPAPGGVPAGGMPPDAQQQPPLDDSGAATDAIPDFDLTPELADEDTTGEHDPLQAMNGDRIPKHLLNGSH